MPAPALIIQYVPITPAFFLVVTFLVLCAGQYISSLFVPGRYRLSNMRAMMRSCRRSSVLTAENSPATDHAARTARPSAPHASTLDLSPTPPSAGWDTHTAYVPAQWWQQHRCAGDASSHPHQTTH